MKERIQQKIYIYPVGVWIFGEASNNIPKDIKEKYDSISWSEMIGLRNITAYGIRSAEHHLIFLKRQILML